MADQISIIAKLLANENINVLKADIPTAAFDIKNRSLVLPHWRDMTTEIEQMLVAHEIGHALWTNNFYCQAIENKILDFPYAQEYLNIFEDVRIERLCKIRYPGIRKTFHEGYKQLADRDFFGLNGRSLESMTFPDRVNVYYKLGSMVQIPFSNKEKPFLRRAEKTETIQDVIALAQDVYNFCKEHSQTFESDVLSSGEYDDLLYETVYGSNSEYFDSDLTGDQNDHDEGLSNNDGFDKSDEQSSSVPVPITNKIFNEKLQQLTNPYIKHRYWTVSPFHHNPVISYKEVIDNITKTVNSKKRWFQYADQDVDVNAFRSETNNNVSYLVKEFEMKKAASDYKRIQISKSGVLDSKKLWAYKFSDDLFKQIQVVKSGKNHGMIFLLDWSSSMDNVIDNTLKQLVNLVTFCKRVQIPFQVLAFANTCISDSTRSWQRSTVNKISLSESLNRIDANWDNFALIELFSHTMSTTDFNTMIGHVVSNRFKHSYRRSSTPLNSALIFMYDYIEKFQSANNVEKLSFITLTDGMGDSFFKNMFFDGSISRSEKHFVVKNNKNYPFTMNNGVDQSNMLLQTIKDRYQCSVVGFFLTGSRDIAYAINSIYPNIDKHGVGVLANHIRSNFKSTGLHVVTDNVYDELYLIKSDQMTIKPTELTINKKLSAAGVATQFSKHLKHQKTSRVLLQKFIEQIA